MTDNRTILERAVIEATIIDAHELRSEAIQQAIKDTGAWVKQAFGAIKAALHGTGASGDLSHTV